MQNLVLSVEAFRSFAPKKSIPGFSLEEFHQHSQLAARLASEIGKSAHISQAVAVAALLHDIGKLVIAERAPEHLARALRGVDEEKLPLYMIEEQLVGVSHAEVGAYLLSLWGLPSPVVEAVAHHHHPERVPQGNLDMISVIYLANQLVHQHAGACDSPEVLPAMEPQILGIPGVSESLPEWNELAETAAHEPQGAGHA